MRSRINLGLMIWTVLFIIPGLAAAATFNVTRLDDPVPGPCISSDCSLREAVLAANDPAGDSSNTINLPAGAYVLTQNGSNEDGGLDGDLDILNNSLTVNGANAATTSIDASGLTNPSGVGDRIFDVVTLGIDVTLNNLTLQNGNPTLATDNQGGAVAVEVASQLTLNQCHLTGNQATNGGGLIVNLAGMADINQSTFSDNEAISSSVATGFGGGIGVIGSNVEINNSTFSGNQAGINGGAIATSDGVLEIRSSTIFNNNATAQGGGISLFSSASSLNIMNSILAGNTDTDASSDCALDGGAFTSAGFNVFGQIASCGSPVASDQNDVTDPGLLPLANYGGPTPTHQLETDSPAIDGGDPSGCDDTSGAPLATDQRGQVREAGGICDTGAVELGDSDLMVTKSADSDVIAEGGDLNYTVVVTNNGPNANFNVALTDTLPSQVMFNSVTTDDDTDVCSQSGGVVSCELGQLNSGDTATVTISVTVALSISGSTLTNTASVQGTEIDPDPDNDSFTLDTPVAGSGGCSLGNPSSSLAGIGFSGILLLAMAGYWVRKQKISES